MNEKRRDSAASVHQRLLNKARITGEPFEVMLTRFALERLLYRLSKSPFSGEFLLKGAMLFALWADQPFRPTRDLDMLGFGTANPQRLADIFRALCTIPVPFDALVFDADTVSAHEIREGQSYDGVRISLSARVGKARIRIQVDIGFGDAVSPMPIEVRYPVLLDHDAPVVRAYSRETVIAEKLEAMISLDIINSRMKDFFDVLVLSRKFEFDGNDLSRAIRATFERRKTSIPTTTPTAFTSEFSKNLEKKKQWRGFLKKIRTTEEVPEELADTVKEIAAFVWPVLHSVTKQTDFASSWTCGGPWQTLK